MEVTKFRPSGFTLIELLVVVTIISILVSLLLPAVQVARESGRRASCQDHLRQISVGLANHVGTCKDYPFGGWGHNWVGVPGRGSGLRQPGSWAYSLLPYIDERELQSLGGGLLGQDADTSFSARLVTPLAIFNCPTRRPCEAWEVASGLNYVARPRPYGSVARVARSDYAINAGSSYIFSFPGPPSLEEGDKSSYWIDKTSAAKFSGVSHLHIAAKLESFEDGFSKTYLVGEKMLDPTRYESGLSTGDNESLYTGFTIDNHRFAGVIGGISPWLPPSHDGDEMVDPRGYLLFGSAHADGFNIAYCDGAVRFLPYDIDPLVHLRAGHRRDDGRPIEELQ